jgi:3-phenylpropionate/trans-cinnamate dioxygenase ferredoxin subunit
MPKFMKVATTDELEDQQGKLVELEGQKIALFRVEEAFHALSDTCTHRGGPLSEGTVEGAEVTCPWHGARFDIKTGAVMGCRRDEKSGATNRSSNELLADVLALICAERPRQAGRFQSSSEPRVLLGPRG